MKSQYCFQPSRLLLLLGIALLANVPARAQALELSDFLEFSYGDCAGTRSCPGGVIKVYSDGRYVSMEEVYESTKSGKARVVTIRREKKLEPDEITDLVSIAEPGLIDAGPEYIVKSQEHPSHITISYRHNRREIRITVIGYDAGNAKERSTVPATVVRLMKWARPKAY